MEENIKNEFYMNVKQYRSFKNISLAYIITNIVWLCLVIFTDLSNIFIFLVNILPHEIFADFSITYVFFIFVNLSAPTLLLSGILSKHNKCNSKLSLILILVFINPIAVTVYNLGFSYFNLVLVANLLGKYVGLSLIPMVILDVFIIWVLYKNSYASRHQKKELRKQKYQYNQCVSLLQNVGKKFFIMNYNKIQTWDIKDIVDTIDPKFMTKDIYNRIKKGKEIFKKGYKLIALDIIVKSKENLDNETIEATRNILKEEAKIESKT